MEAYFREHPEALETYLSRNPRYVFFTEYPASAWPAGSLGVQVTPETSLATDKKIYPRGGVLLVNTQAVTFSSGTRPFLRFMLDNFVRSSAVLRNGDPITIWQIELELIVCRQVP